MPIIYIPRIARRYLTALAIIALSAAGAYIVLMLTVSAQENSAEVINLSGRQRMLSQRIAKLVLIETNKNFAAESSQGLLAETIDLMEKSHESLSLGDSELGIPAPASQALQDMYFSPPLDVDRKVREYLSYARVLLSPDADEKDKMTASKYVASQALGELLVNLDAIVEQHEMESKNAIRNLYLVDTGIFILTLLILVLELTFIFRPMERDIFLQQQSLAKGEERLRLLIKSTPAAITMLDRDLKILFYSRQWLKDYDLVGKSVEGKSYYDVFPNTSKRMKGVFQRCLKGMAEKNGEDRVERPDGKVEWVKWQVYPWYESDGIVGGVMLFSELVSAERQARSQGKQYQAQLEEIIEKKTIALEAAEAEIAHISDFTIHSPYPIVELDEKGVVLNINPAAQGMFPDLQSDPNHTYLADVSKDLRSMIEEKEKFNVREVRVWNKVFEQFIILVEGNSDEKRFLLYGHEITQRKSLQNLSEQQKSLFEIIVDNLPIALFVKDIKNKWRWVVWNKRAEDIFGFNREDVLGKDDFENFENKTQAEFFRATDKKVVKQGELFQIDRENVKTPNGEFVVKTKKVPVYDENGVPHLLIGITEDITDVVEGKPQVKKSK